MDQLPLFEFDLIQRKVKRARRGPDYWEKRAMKFDLANPDVFSQAVKHGHFLLSHGHKHYGIAGFWEKFRWHESIPEQPNPTEEFKLNNNYKAYFARKLAALYPEFQDFFRLRETKSERRHRLRGSRR